MPHIDLYQAYGLDRRQPPEALSAQLTATFNATDPRDQLTRSRIDTARAILADPQRRARYDAQLGDPAAPTLDEASLAAIAGRPVPTAPRTGVAGAFAETKARVLAGVVAALSVILAVAVTAVACSSSDDGSDSATGTSPSAQSSDASEESVESSSETTDPVDQKYPKQARIGDTIEMRLETSAGLGGGSHKNLVLVHLNSLTKVTNPTPECSGEYYALAMTQTAVKDATGFYRYKVQAPIVDAYSLTGKINGPKSDGAPERTLPPGASAPGPVDCPTPDSARPKHRIGPGDTFSITAYTKVFDDQEPVVLHITDTAAFIKIRENLR